MLAFARTLLLCWAGLFAGAPAIANTVVHLATTTQIAKTGVLQPLLRRFKQASGVEVQVVAGTAAQVVALARRGEVDLVLLEDDRAELRQLAAGDVVGRRLPFMFNEFVLAGPRADAARVRGKDILAAFRTLDAARAVFISRGDRSLTHSVEQRTWLRAGMKTARGGRLRECGCDMASALGLAAAGSGYTLTDKASWAAFRHRRNLAVLVEGDPRLRVGYSIAPVAPARVTWVRSAAQKARAAQRERDRRKFMQWLTSAPARAAIASHRLDGHPFFYPKVVKP